MKGRDQLIVWFASAAHPKLELEKIDILERNIKFRQLLTCGYKQFVNKTLA